MAINFRSDNNYSWGGPLTLDMRRRTAEQKRTAAINAAPSAAVAPPTQADKDTSIQQQPPANPVGPMPYTSQGQLPPLGGGFRPVQPPSPIALDRPAGEPVDISTQQFPTEFLGNVLAGTDTTPAFQFPDNTLGQEQEDIVQGLAGVDFTGREQPVFNPVTNRYTWEGNSFSPNELRETFGFPAVSDSSEPIDTAYGSFATQDAFDFFQKYLGEQFPLGI